MPDENAIAAFLTAACVPLGTGHASGTLEEAETIRAAQPEIARADIFCAAVLGEAAMVGQFLARRPQAATERGGVHDWDALTYLCFSRYLRLDPSRSEGLVRSAAALLEAGADPNTGFYSPEHSPVPTFERVLYGAAGVAHHPELTRLLLEHGADPNDGEVAYHTPESYDNRALHLLVQTGKVTAENLATMLLRKADWHDEDGIRWLLEHGADPNRLTHWGKTALHNATLSDNALSIFRVLLDHGADPTIRGTHPHVHRSAAGRSAVAIAAERGRGDVLELFQSRGFSVALEGMDALLSACARNDRAAIDSLVRNAPGSIDALRGNGGQLLVQFAGNGNTAGVRQLLELKIEVEALCDTGDPYFQIPPRSTALHAAAWRARHETVRFLLSRGAPVNAQDGAGCTPLMLAVRACVASHWKNRRSPESVRALLEAGATTAHVPWPTGYDEVDDLLRRQRGS